jgi:DNA-binding response OmpR family regulator
MPKKQLNGTSEKTSLNGGPQSPMSILIVEDETLIAMGLEMYFRKEGYDPSQVSTVKQALKLLQEKTFAACLCDLGLPDGDGWEIIGKLHELEETTNNKNIPFIMLSGGFADEIPEEIKNLPNIKAILDKPCSQQSILNTLKNFL